MGASDPWAANHRSGGQRDLKSSAGGVTCLCSLPTAGCTWLQALAQTGSDVTAPDGGLCMFVTDLAPTSAGQCVARGVTYTEAIN